MTPTSQAIDVQDGFAVQELISRFYGALDGRDYEAVVDCFHDEGAWHRQGKTMTGKRNMVASLQQRNPALVVHHLFSNCLFESPDPGRIKVRYLLTVFMGDASAATDGAPLVAAAPQVGFCDAEAVHVGGRWQIWHMQLRTPTFKGG